MLGYCDFNTQVELYNLGFSSKTYSLYDTQLWLMSQGIYVAPKIYSYHNVNVDDEVSWECTVYVQYQTIFTVGEKLSYEDALLLGIQEGIKYLKA